MTARTWTRQLFARTPRTIRQAPARFRPLLEVLEGRLAPATLTVTTLSDAASPTGMSLRQAIAKASKGDTIQFQAGLSGPIDLSTAEKGQGTLTLSQDVTIDGSGATITVEGGSTKGSTSNAQPFVVNSGVTATLENLTISNGYGGTGGTGGGIDNKGTLTISNCTLSGNSALGGGGIYNVGALSVNNCTLWGNSANSGGGIQDFGGTGTVSNSTLSGNSAVISGGGIENDFATLTVSNCTLAGNSSGDGFTDGISSFDATLTLNNSIVANNPNGTGIDNQGGTLTGSHNRTGTVALGPLANYGGATQTMALLPGSAAIGGVPANTTTTPHTDQRGFHRDITAATDIGAFEVQPTDSTVALTASPGPSVYGQSVILTAAVSLTLSGTQATAGTVTFLDGSTVLASGVGVAASGQATYSTTALTAGTHNLVAVYSGAGAIGGVFLFLPSAGAVTQVVNPLAVKLSGSRIYDGTTTAAAGILSITNLVGGDQVTLSGSATLAGAGAGAEAISSFAGLQLGGAAAANYTLSGASGSVTILSYADATTNLQTGPKGVDTAGLDQGLQNSLDSQLQAAIAYFAAGDTADGVSQLGAFINHVRAQSGKGIADAALAKAWIDYAQEIIKAVG
jgi:hypothetical protein